MIDALMYGMMPSAKIVTRDRLPPENMSYRPNIVFCACRASSSSAAGFTPGVGMWWPTRYTASMPEREQHAVAQVGDGEDVLQVVEH